MNPTDGSKKENESFLCNNYFNEYGIFLKTTTNHITTKVAETGDRKHYIQIHPIYPICASSLSFFITKIDKHT